MTKRSLLVAILASGTLLSCDALTVTTMGVAILTKTPDLAQSGIVDQRLLTAVGELPVAQAVLATTFVGERPSLQNQEPPAGIAGATVRLAFAGRMIDLVEVTAAPEAQGTYMAISVDLAGQTDDDPYVDSALEYLEEQAYTVYIDVLGDYFELALTAPPAIPASAVSFNGGALPTEDIAIPTQAPLALNTHARNQALTVAWQTDPPRQAFVTLARVRYTGAADMSDVLDSGAWAADTSNPIFDSFPRTPEGFLSLVTEQPTSEVVLEASHFSQPGLYVLLLTVVDLDTDNAMALGSAGIAGVATPFAFLVKP